IVFGSEKESRIGKYAPSQYGNTVGIVGQQYEMTAKTDSPEHNRVASPTHPATVEPNMTSSEIAPPNFEYREKVQALHAYQANPEDPNELSFTKGEILEVVDRNGNWWQARKSDGTIGIIPSNYAGIL
ncbi:SH3 domain-containing protein, partial [Gilbertella persicaria]|uniref:SH3 domain-containing protein n=1 Tax=Gilbertella persicaria TaxID=101096 RepID=UPI00221ECB10